MGDATPTERELKIPVPSLTEVRRQLAAAGARRLAGPSREVNVLLDDEDGSLAAAGEVLRLRRHAGRWLLTFKGRARFEDTLKSREELETEVTDGDAALAVLARLGFTPRRRYEKDRERWRLGAVEVALDHTPLGEFVELEGPEDSPLRAALALGLDPAQALRASYVGLWARHRQDHPELELPEDMVFPP